MSHIEQFIELLERWEELPKLGRDVSLRELCRNFPGLLDEVQQAVGKLRRIDTLLSLETGDSADTPAEDGSTLSVARGTLPLPFL
jgi:hypothetical protein